jgi:hypothetical protein
LAVKEGVSSRSAGPRAAAADHADAGPAALRPKSARDAHPRPAGGFAGMAVILV